MKDKIFSIQFNLSNWKHYCSEKNDSEIYTYQGLVLRSDLENKNEFGDSENITEEELIEILIDEYNGIRKSVDNLRKSDKDELENLILKF